MMIQATASRREAPETLETRTAWHKGPAALALTWAHQAHTETRHPIARPQPASCLLLLDTLRSGAGLLRSSVFGIA